MCLLTLPRWRVRLTWIWRSLCGLWCAWLGTRKTSRRDRVESSVGLAKLVLGLSEKPRVSTMAIGIPRLRNVAMALSNVVLVRPQRHAEHPIRLRQLHGRPSYQRARFFAAQPILVEQTL